MGVRVAGAASCAPPRTEVLVHEYTGRPVVFVSQTGAVGSWMSVEAEGAPGPASGEARGARGGVGVSVRFMLGRRSEEENAALELLAAAMMRAYVRRRAGEPASPALVVAAGLRSYDAENIRGIVELFESAL